MRALDCAVCGEVVQADDDAGLVDAMRRHLRDRHDGDGEDEIEGRVASDAYAPPAREPGERWIVELEFGRVIAAHGPLADDDRDADALAMKTAAHGRSPAFTEEAARLEERRDEFERLARPGGGGRDS